jgi:hypothetical protein
MIQVRYPVIMSWKLIYTPGKLVENWNSRCRKTTLGPWPLRTVASSFYLIRISRNSAVSSFRAQATPQRAFMVRNILIVGLWDVAPGGQTALLYNHRLDDQQGSWTWLRTSDLTTIKSMQGPRTGLIRASDQAGIFYGTDDREMLLDGKTNVLCTRCDSHFLTNDLLFLAKEQSYAIQTVSGNEQGSGRLDIQAHNFARAAQATRFAYSTGHYVEHVFPIQTEFDLITCKIMVVDWKTNKPVAEIDINEPAGNPSAGLAQLALALSPDGQYLAVLLHQKVTLYRLPE